MATQTLALVVVQSALTLPDPNPANQRFTITLSDPAVPDRRNKPSLVAMDVGPTINDAWPVGLPISVTFTF